MNAPTNVPQLRAILRTLKSSEIDLALSDLLSSGAGEWMSRTQKYADGRARAALRRTHPLPVQSARAMKQYVAASVFLHTADSWSLLGRAMSAFATGDVPIAQHLLYYSELRAAQAIMSRYGIVLIDKNPFCYVGADKTESLRAVLALPTTHAATWDVFSAWADEYAAEFLGKSIRVAGFTATDWADARPVPVSLNSTAAELVKRWGLDLEKMKAERSTRNSVSYEPARLIKSESSLTPAMVASAFQEVWSLLEPSGATSLENFDRALLRQILQVSFKSAHGVTHRSRRRFTADTKATLANLGLDKRDFGLEDYLLDDAPSTDVLKSAKEPAPLRPRSDSKEFLAMRTRASILARFALGAAKDLAQSAGLRKGDLSFWVGDLLSSHAIAFEDDGAYLDLWDEMSQALEQLEPMQALTSPADFPATRNWAAQIGLLSSFERVAAWAVA